MPRRPYHMLNDVQPTKKYDCTYLHDGKTWALRIDAYNWADAEIRVAKLGFLRLEGEHIADIPSWAGAWLPRLYCWIRNLFR